MRFMHVRGLELPSSRLSLRCSLTLAPRLAAVASVAQISSKEPPKQLFNEDVWNKDSDLETDGYSVSKVGLPSFAI